MDTNDSLPKLVMGESSMSDSISSSGPVARGGEPEDESEESAMVVVGDRIDV